MSSSSSIRSFDALAHGLTAKKSAQSFTEWYSQLVFHGQFADSYPITGFYIIKPKAMFIWNQIKDFLSREFGKLGIEEYYFPLVLKREMIQKEMDHLKGFTPELAWITRSGVEELHSPLALRPTSESIIYSWLQQHLKSPRQLPLRINQWCNVLRWESKTCLPFVRSREFLWQEGHSVFATKQEALQETEQMIQLYAKMYKELLCIPMIHGVKSRKETFAGAVQTKSLESLIPKAGKSIQACTAHHLGQNFSQMFGILPSPVGAAERRTFPFQNSWGITTRSIGIALMVHSDDVGIVLPPSVAPIQVCIVPCGLRNPSKYASQNEKIMQKCQQINIQLQALGVRSEIDAVPDETSGFKFNKQEFNGIPLRIEIGPMELAENAPLIACKRTQLTRIKFTSLQEVPEFLRQIQQEMLQKASLELSSLIEGPVNNFGDLEIVCQKNNHFALIGWCESECCEEILTQKVKGKIICLPSDFEKERNNLHCLNCKKETQVLALYGNSF